MPAHEEQRQPWARTSEAPLVQVVPTGPLPIKANEPLPVAVVDITMPFGSMVTFMVKWTLASIPAFMILVVFGAVAYGVLMGVVDRFAP